MLGRERGGICGLESGFSRMGLWIGREKRLMAWCGVGDGWFLEAEWWRSGRGRLSGGLNLNLDGLVGKDRVSDSTLVDLADKSKVSKSDGSGRS